MPLPSKNKPRGLLIAGNWKMNNGLAGTEKYFSDLKHQEMQVLSAGADAFFANGTLKACLCVPYLSLVRANELSKGLAFPITIAAQNVHWEKSGAFTGEISALMLQEVGVDHVLVGHSERRQFFGETDETVRKRAETALAQGFRTILCIGETRAERESGKTQDVLNRQLLGAFPEPGKGAAAHLDGRLILAYEPVWAIGTGLTASPEQAEEAHQMIRRHLAARFGAEASARTPILYGGSVTPDNVDSLLNCANVDGALVGGASLKPEGYLALLAAAARAIAKN